MQTVKGLNQGAVVVTTCNRPDFIKLTLPALKKLIGKSKCYDLIVSIDGTENQLNIVTLEYVRSLGIRCIIAELQEGVGVSKNRVLSLLPNYDFYFFLDDDAEINNLLVFDEHLRIAESANIHHFSLHHPRRLLKIFDSSTYGKTVVQHAYFGGAQFNFYTKYSLDIVGGWHKNFSLYKRGGHTEHSYRIYRKKLVPGPFNFISKLANLCEWYEPAHVVWNENLPQTKDGIYTYEAKLIDKKLPKQPFYSLSKPQLIE